MSSERHGTYGFTVEEIEGAMQPALNNLTAIARAVCIGHAGDDSEWAGCIADGSQYSPSWRTLPALETLYQSDTDGSVSEIIGEVLDEFESEWSGHNEETMSWHEGCLFVFSANFNFDNLA